MEIERFFHFLNPNGPLPAEGIRRLIDGDGDFGVSPFSGQLTPRQGLDRAQTLTRFSFGVSRANVRRGTKADMPTCPSDLRFRRQKGGGSELARQKSVRQDPRASRRRGSLSTVHHAEYLEDRRDV
jgi:hypothetical protein